jgi:glycosyltransferase involved in cell wall biosynthesis
MIVRDEAHVGARAIASVRHLIDRYAIVDTGSSDDTQRVAEEALSGLPGQYAHAAWQGYGPARCLSLDLADAVCWGQGYALVVDADDVWTGERPSLADEADAYAVWYRATRAKWSTTRYLKLGRGIRYEGVVHEMPVGEDGNPVMPTVLEGLSLTSPMDGATYRDPEKYLVHARMISTALASDPGNTRLAFYLAQSYRDHGDHELAARLYLARAAMGAGTYAEEVYVSYLEAGRALWRLGRHDAAQRAFLNAHASYPGRREAMAELARLFAVKAATSPTVGTLFVEDVLGDEEAT